MISWTIYDHPSDYPDVYVARQFVDVTPTANVLLSSDLTVLQEKMQELGLYRFERREGDDPVILETWL